MNRPSVTIQFNAVYFAVARILSEVLGASQAESTTEPYVSPTGKMERAKITKRLNGWNYEITIIRRKSGK